VEPEPKRKFTAEAPGRRETKRNSVSAG